MPHRRIAGAVWGVFGIVLMVWALFELGKGVLRLSFPTSALLLLVYGVLASVGALYLYYGNLFGRIVIAAAATVGLAVAVVMVMVNVENLTAPVVLALGVLCGYGLFAAIKRPKHVA